MAKKKAGKTIRTLRERKAWTQEHLADAARISVRTVQRAEDGALSAETMTAIAGALDEPVESITGADGCYPSIVPIIYYEQASTLDWLARAFGFGVTNKMLGPGEAILHAELSYGEGLIMVGAPLPSREWKTPKGLSGILMQSAMVFVDDVDAHHERAIAAGAKILEELQESYGMRRYRAEDPEGHVWTFAQSA